MSDEKLTDERNPRDPKDTRPFEIMRGLTPDPAWVVRAHIGGNSIVVFRAQTFNECVKAFAPIFVPELRLLGEIESLRAKVAELEKDKARLDWLDKNLSSKLVDPLIYSEEGKLREAMDAAMGEKGGVGEMSDPRHEFRQNTRGGAAIDQCHHCGGFRAEKVHNVATKENL